MKDEDVQIGMKVVPHDKTPWGHEDTPVARMNTSNSYRRAETLNQPFLYVVGLDEDDGWVLSEYKEGSGDYFLASDFEPYVEIPGVVERGDPDADYRSLKAPLGGEEDGRSQSSKDSITYVLHSLESLLHYKNEKYGNSALNPLGVFSKAEAGNSICIRLDDKLQRIKNGDTLRKNDIADMLGYLTLLCVDKGWTSFEEFKD